MPDTVDVNMHEFGELGLQYYICGRYSSFCSFPITGNLLHHAVELFLKMALSCNFTDSQFRSRRFGHKLTSLWTEFKKINSAVSLTKYDKTIKDLDKWEEIRYPSRVYRLLTLWLDKSIPISARHGGSAPEHYEIVLGELDELVSVIFQTASISPGLFKDVFFKKDKLPELEKFYRLGNNYLLKFY